jgi:hypothetical protein
MGNDSKIARRLALSPGLARRDGGGIAPKMADKHFDFATHPRGKGSLCPPGFALQG